MKKLFTLLSIALIGTSTYAQEGNMYIGRIAGFTLEKEVDPSGDETKYTSWSFSPEVGTWLTDDLQLGLALNFSRKDWGSVSDLSIDVLSPGIYLRKWKSIGEKFSVFGGGNVAYTSTKIERSDVTTKEVGFNAFIDIGAGFELSERWSVLGRYATIGYSFQKNKDTDAKVTKFGLDVNTLGNPFNIGIYYTFKE